jgi:hypothetical protein
MYWAEYPLGVNLPPASKTMASQTREVLCSDCEALNAAFDELGFEWQWDPDLYASLAGIEDERERVAAYLRQHQPHLLQVYDLGNLCDAILAARHHHGGPFAVAA